MAVGVSVEKPRVVKPEGGRISGASGAAGTPPPRKGQSGRGRGEGNGAFPPFGGVWTRGQGGRRRLRLAGATPQNMPQALGVGSSGDEKEDEARPVEEGVCRVFVTRTSL